MLDSTAREKYLRFWFGAVAQLGERVVRNDEVRGSIPLGSTNPHYHINISTLLELYRAHVYLLGTQAVAGTP
jgi:hypothetical protein